MGDALSVPFIVSWVKYYQDSQRWSLVVIMGWSYGGVPLYKRTKCRDVSETIIIRPVPLWLIPPAINISLQYKNWKVKKIKSFFFTLVFYFLTQTDCRTSIWCEFFARTFLFWVSWKQNKNRKITLEPANIYLHTLSFPWSIL